MLIEVDRLGGRPNALTLLVQHHARRLNHNLAILPFPATLILLLLTQFRMALASAQKRLLVLLTILLLHNVAIILPAFLQQDVVQLSLNRRLLLARRAAELG